LLSLLLKAKALDTYALHAYNTGMESVFDPDKNKSNIDKHNLPLSEGDGVLNDPLARTKQDIFTQGEQRHISIGANVFGELRVVVYHYRGEEVRIISVRKPEPNEVKSYEK
jgi:uncharacterized protein